jgi:hypothetical protein
VWLLISEIPSAHNSLPTLLVFLSALIDIDEFLVPQTPQYTNIHGILEDYLVPYGGALVSNWMLFGSANRTVYSPVPVTKRFQYRDAEPNHVVKSIVKATDFQGNRNPHAVKLADPTNVHTTEYPGAIQPNVYNESDKTKASSFVKASGVLLVHHYRYTSDKEHFYKVRAIVERVIDVLASPMPLARPW